MVRKKSQSLVALRNDKEKIQGVRQKTTATEFTIEYVKQHVVSGSSEPGIGPVGHIHLSKLLLQDLNVSTQEVCQRCEEIINSLRKKKNVGHFFKKIILSFWGVALSSILVKAKGYY